MWRGTEDLHRELGAHLLLSLTVPMPVVLLKFPFDREGNITRQEGGVSIHGLKKFNLTRHF